MIMIQHQACFETSSFDQAQRTTRFFSKTADQISTDSGPNVSSNSTGVFRCTKRVFELTTTHLSQGREGLFVRRIDSVHSVKSRSLLCELEGYQTHLVKRPQFRLDFASSQRIQVSTHQRQRIFALLIQTGQERQQGRELGREVRLDISVVLFLHCVDITTNDTHSSHHCNRHYRDLILGRFEW